MLKNFSPTNESHLRSALRNLTAAVLLLLAFAVTASAYTLVFRDGRRIEIPSEFTVTRTMLTYEISPGFTKTMQTVLIDVAATERANNEAPGSFFKHTEEAPVATEPVLKASRTLTNRDLATVRQRRIASEQAYESRRTELGLPTVEETRNRQEAEGAALRAQFREESVAKAREESYWRGRARELRTEIATVDTQINYLRGRVSELNESSLNNRSWVTGVYPLWPNNRPWSGNGRWGSLPNQGLPGYRPARPVIGLGLPSPYGYPGGYGYPGTYGYPGAYGYPGGYGYPSGPFDNNGFSSDPAELNSRLDDLLVRRAGLAAQWRTLEDEARDARVPQVWLEP